MRNISGPSLAKILSKVNVEPLILVKIFWNGSPTVYGDKKITQEGVQGKVLEISGIEDIVDLTTAASSVNLSLVLDDSDGTLKNIYDQTDVHKTYVQILQWFSGIPISEAFIIFEGEISSPIVWSEGARTLAFDVVTKLEDLEVGFSVEEGKFDTIPADLVGKSWPVVFGNVFNMPLLSLVQSPTAILANGFGIVNHQAWDAELADIALQLMNCSQAAGQADYLRFQAQNKANYWAASPPFGGGDPDQAEQYQQQANGYQQQFLEYLSQYTNMQLDYTQRLSQYELQKTLDVRTVPITSSNFPPFVQTSIQINNWTFDATINNNVMQLSNEKVIPDINLRANQFNLGPTVSDYRQTQSQNTEKFSWFEGGSELKIFNFPRKYIVGIGVINVVNVWGHNRHGRQQLPREWYTVTVENFNGLTVTFLNYPMPLSSRPGFWDESDPQVDCVGELTNVVDIMIWAIQNYSPYTYNNADFVYVRNKLLKYPANFALLDRKNLVDFLKDLAFQSRCAIWINDRVFRLRFLPEQPNPVETVTDSDVEVDSLELTSDETETRITKFTATYSPRIGQESYKIIFRANIQKYGTVEESYNFYIFNDYESVAKAAEYWLIQKANSWKHVTCRLTLNKLRIEAFDPVQVSFNEAIAANTPVTGIVQKATYDSSSDTISLDIKLPVRLGEMTQYEFAFPFTVTTVFPKLTDPNVVTGNPFEDAQGNLVPVPQITFAPAVVYRKGQGTITQGRGVPIADAEDEPLGALVVALDPNAVNTTRPPGLATFNNTVKYEVKPVKLLTVDIVPKSSAAYPGYVRTREGDNVYGVDAYLDGLANPATRVIALEFDHPADDEITPDTPVIVHVSSTGGYFMLTPSWMKYES